MADFAELSAELAQLEARLRNAAAEAAGLEGELEGLTRTLGWTRGEVEALARGFGQNWRRAFDAVIVEGRRMSDALRGLARSMAETLYAAALRPVQGALGQALAAGVAGLFQQVLPFANGASFAQGRVMPFASGAVVSGPVTFPLRGGWGVMGEAGPEAILPLQRGADGRLGIRAQGGPMARPVHVVFNIQTPDLAGFERSKIQIAAELQRLLAHGQRNL